MAEFVVNTTQLASCAAQMSALQRELDAVAVKLGAMQLGSVLQIKASTALIGKIGDCKWAAAHQSDNLGDLAKGLNEIAELYETCERRLTEPRTQAQANANSAAEEDHNILYDIAEWFQNIPGVISDLIGEVTDVFVSGAGDVITVITRFFQNAYEFGGDLLDPRFWAEFGLESFIEIGKGALIGAGIGLAVVAIASAAGVTLPFWGTGLIVAGGTVLVSWAIDAVFELITGNEGGISEWISDNIIDGVVDAAETVADVASDIIDTVAEGVEAAWNGLVDLFT